jgi:hypothetical protein
MLAVAFIVACLYDWIVLCFRVALFIWRIVPMSRANPRFRRVNPSLPPPGTGAVIQITAIGIVEGQETINTFYYYCSTAGALTTADLIAALAAWRAAFSAHYIAAMSSDWKSVNLIAACLTQPSLVTIDDFTWAGTNGGGPAGHEPTQVAVCVSRYTAFKGQHGRGRIYLPAVPTGWVTNSNVTTVGAYVQIALDLALGFTANANIYVPAVVQRSKVSPRPVVGVAAVVEGTARFLTATIRRRRIGRGK